MIRNNIIIGTGGFGREVYEWVKENYGSESVKGFLTKDKINLNDYKISEPILGDGNEDNYKIVKGDAFIFGIGDIDIKKRIISNLLNRGAHFKRVIHRTACVSPKAEIGIGCVLAPFSFVSSYAVLDDFVTLNYYASCAHDTKVGKYSILSPYATINGNVVLGEETFLGTHSLVSPGKIIGNKCKINVGVSVTSDMEDETCAFTDKAKYKKIIYSV